MKRLKPVLWILFTVPLIVLLAGIIKFNFLDVPHTDTQVTNTQVNRSGQTDTELNDSSHTNAIVWREIHLSLLNDALEAPETDEVQHFFQTQYADDSGRFQVQVTKQNDIFVIKVPLPEELRDLDFFDRRGALLATYEVMLHDAVDREDYDNTTVTESKAADSKVSE